MKPSPPVTKMLRTSGRASKLPWPVNNGAARQRPSSMKNLDSKLAAAVRSQLGRSTTIRTSDGSNNTLTIQVIRHCPGRLLLSSAFAFALTHEAYKDITSQKKSQCVVCKGWPGASLPAWNARTTRARAIKTRVSTAATMQTHRHCTTVRRSYTGH